ncbi:hypothetical protein Q3H58_004930 [Pseudomonas psychrotolerans]|nr:hypothetical protein [Pseudomonas psychrotolerans]
MTDGYDCYQNALAERVNGILKTELLLISPENLGQAKETVDEAVHIYNSETGAPGPEIQNARCGTSGVLRPFDLPEQV